MSVVITGLWLTCCFRVSIMWAWRVLIAVRHETRRDGRVEKKLHDEPAGESERAGAGGLHESGTTEVQCGGCDFLVRGRGNLLHFSSLPLQVFRCVCRFSSFVAYIDHHSAPQGKRGTTFTSLTAASLMLT
eukprot:1745810-Pleurochrysis_carterae.AAC.3